ncbi:MAG: hypothetical protein OXF41_06795 [bacterium]|nr:hypothetical protein [bacterium]
MLAARFEGRADTIRIEIGLTLATVAEWFSVRSIVAETLDRAGLGVVDCLDSWSALVLAEHLHIPLFTASDELHRLGRSDQRTSRHQATLVAPSPTHHSCQLLKWESMSIWDVLVNHALLITPPPRFDRVLACRVRVSDQVHTSEVTLSVIGGAHAVKHTGPPEAGRLGGC